MSSKGLLDRFALSRPLAVMTRVILDAVITEDLDDVFHAHRQQGYERDLLYSQLASTIAEVVLGFCTTPNQAYDKFKQELSVSKTAFYEKLKRVEPAVCRASVKHSYQRCRQMMEHLKFQPWEIVRGYHCKMIDGNHLEGCENRLEELRTAGAKGLPGTAVVVMDAQLQMAEDIFLIPDGHATERSIFGDILETVNAKDLIVGDSHYCTINFLTGIANRKGCFVVRQHGTLKGEQIDKQSFVAETPSGKVYEQSLGIGKDGFVARRITVKLNKPTQDGDTEIHILSNLPARVSTARIAEIYQLRGDIEHLFYLATTTLTCEVKSLNYPQSALFVFCVAMMAINCRQVMMAGLVAAHDEEILEDVSHFSVASEIAHTYDGVAVAFTEDEWRELLPNTLAARMRFLIQTAKNFDRRRHRKSKRGIKKQPPKKTRYKNGTHLSVQKILNERK